MGVRNIDPICSFLIGKNKWSSSTPVALIQSGTTAEQAKVLTTLGRAPKEAQEMGLKSPAIIVIGEVCDVLPESQSLPSAVASDVGGDTWGKAQNPLP
mmetsp:Transcript_12296/g.14123  ORF Transcript_12296/g.14123 Transcript_12296/m.14123 type:complete len:98 (+) Transcript_12296:97-390(+)